MGASDEINWEALKMMKGGRITPRVWNRVIDIIHSVCIVSVTGAGDFRRIFGAGTNLMIYAGGGGAAPEITHPWRLKDKSVGSTPKITVDSDGIEAGSISDVIASIDGNKINIDGGDTPPTLECSDGDDLYALLQLDFTGVYIDDSSGSGVALQTTTTGGAFPAPDTAIPPTYAAKKIATLAVHFDDDGNASVSWVPLVNTQLWFQMCAGSPLYGTVSA